jgi:hypothetical protein
MRASARPRVTFVPAKVTKTIRSAVHGRTNAATPGWRGAADAQPFGFPRVLGQTGEAVNSLHSNIRPLVSCLPCAARLRVSRSWRHFQDFRRSPHRGRNLRREGSAPTDEFERCVIVSLLTRRASQSLTGEKRDVFERSELASASQECEAQSSRQAALAGCLFFC